MADMFTKRKRSEIMARIRAKNTGIEKTVFSYLRRQGIYFQQHYDKVPGKPDIALPSKKIAVFINGDFWHGYKFSVWRDRIPREYWLEKITLNIRRDQKNVRKLRRQGWRVLKVWGHEVLESPEKTCVKIGQFLRDKSPASSK